MATTMIMTPAIGMATPPPDHLRITAIRRSAKS
jgi:hypothetical protein